jgi:hypothetical protein
VTVRPAQPPPVAEAVSLRPAQTPAAAGTANVVPSPEQADAVSRTPPPPPEPKRGPAPSWEESDSLARSASRAIPASRAAPVSTASPVSGEDFDFGEADPGGVELELAVSIEKMRRTERPKQQAAAPRRTEDLRVKQIGGYGLVPGGFTGTASYALRVTRRKLKIRGELRALTAQRRQPAESMNRSLLRAGEIMFERRADEELAPYASMMRAVEGAERSIEEVATDGEQFRASSAQQMNSLTEAIESARREAKPMRKVETELLSELKRHEEERKRQQERIRRSNKEYHDLKKAMIGAPDPAWLAAMEEQQEARQAKLDAVDGKIDDVNRRIAEVRRRLARNKEEADALHGQLRSHQESRSRDERTIKARTSEARTAREVALIELGREGMVENLKGVADSDLADARESGENIRQIDREITLHERALEAYDAGAFARGMFALVLLAVFLVGAAVGARLWLLADTEEGIGHDMQTIEVGAD